MAGLRLQTDQLKQKEGPDRGYQSEHIGGTNLDDKDMPDRFQAPQRPKQT